MKRPNGGQSSHTPGDDRDPDSPRRWQKIPAESLWEFAVELVARHRLRGVAQMNRHGRETVRKFIMRTVEPNLTTRRAFAKLYRAFHAERTMADADKSKPWRTRPPRLIEVLSPGKAVARAELAKILELAHRFPDEVPPTADALFEWIDAQVTGEYWFEEYYGAIARGERDHDEESFLAGEPKRKRSRRKPKSKGSGDTGSGEPAGDEESSE